MAFLILEHYEKAPTSLLQLVSTLVFIILNQHRLYYFYSCGTNTEDTA